MAPTGFSRVLRRAAIGPLNMGVLGAGVLGAVALASWPIAALGGAAYAALVATDLANPKFRRKVLSGRERPGKVPAAKQVADPEARALVEALAGAQAELEKMVRDTPERVRRNLHDTIKALAELEGHAALLVTRCDELHRYLAATAPDEARAEATTLAAQASATRDPAAKQSYREAAAAAEERVRAIQDIADARVRVLANLSRVVATMKSVPAKLVKLRALDDQASDAVSGDVGAELERMSIDLKAFEQTLEALAPVKQMEVP